MVRLLQVRSHERGAALVELAISIPVLVMIAVGTTDLARGFRMTTVLTSASRAGAQYGAQSAAQSSDVAGMTNIARTVVSANLAGTPTITVSRLCECVTASGTYSNTSPVNSCTDPCAGRFLAVHVTVTSTASFNLVSRIPGVPTTMTVSRSATMRAQ